MLELQRKLKYSFKDPQLLATALTHSSYANESRSGSRVSNERLEFLGDSVLGFVTAEYLYKSFPELPEGRMTRLRAELVCEQSLHTVAKELGLGSYIVLGKGEENTGGRTRSSILADCVEAIIAAMFIDGGTEPARAFITEHILARSEDRHSRTGDYKSRLQELVQRDGAHALDYTVLSESGPDHCKSFTVEVSLDGHALGSGEGRSKKEAEQMSAMHALESLEQ